MSKRAINVGSKNAPPAPVIVTIDPTECPFREFRDNELQPEFWGMEESNGGKMSVADMQLSHAQVLLRSSFCREVLSACFMLEKTEFIAIEHLWENFACTFGPEGWRTKYHIYSPGLKPGGGSQHRPVLSKNGCYLIRLYHLGAWRCVWVSDQVPVDATGAPLLPFSPLLSKAPATKPGTKQAPPMVTSQVVYLWPLLLCKALLKLAVPDMIMDEFNGSLEDEKMPYFNILHALTGAININYKINDENLLWDLITSEIPLFSWDDDDETHASTLKSKSTKKTTGKEISTTKSRGSMVYVILRDSKDQPPYQLPGVTPGFEMSLLITMARDLPLKKPLPEPEVALWKYYRWVDWAKAHGLYEAYECPRTRFLKANGLMKLSYAPHLLDVQSTESITIGFVKAEQSKTVPVSKGKSKDSKPPSVVQNTQGLKEELREWLKFDSMYKLILSTNILYYPSIFEMTSAASSPPIRMTKIPQHSKTLDIQAPKYAPLYFQIDGPETNTLRISLSMLHPRILTNSGVLVADKKQLAYLVLEKFEWFQDSHPTKPKGYVKTCGYDSVEIKFEPGRHFCRVWVQSRMNWHIMLISESRLQLGPRDQIQCAAARECPWVSKYLTALGTAFSNWLKINRSNLYLPNVADQDFFKYYYPDLPWDNEIVGYDRALLHWMFRQALQVHLSKRLLPSDRAQTYPVLRKYFMDPSFGLPPITLPTFSLRTIANLDPCDCVLSEIEEIEILEEQAEEMVEQEAQVAEESPKVSPEVMQKLLVPPEPPIASNICELATEELPCGILKEERSKVIRKHEAATVIQSYWRGIWARKCLKEHVVVSVEVLKALQDAVYGTQEALMGLMNEFFGMYPGTKNAYSISSALSGVYGLNQHQGTSPVTPKCKWVPFFQGVFYCHASVKVHFDISGTLQHSTVAVYDNDTGLKLPQAYNAYKTFDIKSNKHGYTVMGHGSLKEAPGNYFDAHWQLTVLSSIDGAFHVCDNEISCRETPLIPATKLHFDEIFLPNTKNVLGGIHFSVTKQEAISFRASATCSELEIVATLRTLSPIGSVEEISKCSGTGEIFWPYINLEPKEMKTNHISQVAFSSPALSMSNYRSVTKGLKSKPSSGRSQKSTTKMRQADPKFYSIQVTAPLGWPLTLSQWKRVDEVRDANEALKAEANIRKPNSTKTVVIKPGSVRDKPMDRRLSLAVHSYQPQPGDAYVELECSVTVGGGIVAKQDEERDIMFTAARKSWKENEPGRNQRGAEIRKLFREENLEVPPQPESIHSTLTDGMTICEGGEAEEFIVDDFKKQVQPGPTPVSESAMLEISIEDEEEFKYSEMPVTLRDKFKPLSFIEICTKELGEDGSVVLSANMAEAAKKDRHARIEAALEKMRELQTFNEVNVLGRQKRRCLLLDKLNVEARWSPFLLQALEERNEAIAQETLARVQSANKKKQELKIKK